MDFETTNNAIAIAGFTKEVNEWVFPKKRTPFEVYK